MFAAVLMAVSLFVGFATFIRCVAINLEDARWVVGMSRLRQASSTQLATGNYTRRGRNHRRKVGSRNADSLMYLADSPPSGPHALDRWRDSRTPFADHAPRTHINEQRAVQSEWSLPTIRTSQPAVAAMSHSKTPISSHLWRQQDRHVQMGTAERDRQVGAALERRRQLYKTGTPGTTSGRMTYVPFPNDTGRKRIYVRRPSCDLGRRSQRPSLRPRSCSLTYCCAGHRATALTAPSRGEE
jgi:hypothetical protein